MSSYSRYNIVYHLQRWMDSVPGQTFLNYAYSWGASIVILGTLFKLTHLPGANFMLFLGMGTEVIVFFLSAFDRPFDKTAQGRELPTHIDNEETDDTPATAPAIQSVKVITQPTTSDEPTTIPATQTPTFVPQMSVEEAEALHQAQADYLSGLNQLVETLAKVNEQSQRLTRDSEEMENLNRTLTGIAKIYEMQLKGASQQVGTIDQINEQTRKMAERIEQLNAIYERMINAMTVNMRAGGQVPGTNM